MSDLHMPFREKQLAALRMWYRGGYTGYFAAQTRRLLRMGFTREELLSACIDDTMRKWIDDAGKQAARGSDLG